MSKYSWSLIEENGIIREIMRPVEQQKADQEDWHYESFNDMDEEDRYTEDPVDGSEQDDIQLSDIIADAILCHGLKDIYHRYGDQCVNEPNQEIQWLAEYNYLVKEYMYCRKMVLGLIHETKVHSRRKYRNQNDNIRGLIESLIRDCRRNMSVWELHEFYGTLFRDPKLARILRKIEKKLENGEFPYYWLEKLAAAHDENYSVRRTIVKLLQDSLVYKPSGNQPLTMQMVLNPSLYEEYIEKAKSIHIANTEKMLNAYLPGAGNPIGDLKNEIRKMREYINRCHEGNQQGWIFKKHRDGKGACYGLLQHGNTAYFALSGVFDYTDDRIKDVCGIHDDTVKKYKHLIENVDKLRESCFPDAVWTRLCLSTRRYPYLEDAASAIPEKGETFKEALQRIPAETCKNYMQYMKDLRCDFTCCERKMFECVSWSEQEKTLLFSKFRPCEKCRNAIRKLNENLYNIHVFYLGEKGLEEWIDTKDEHVERNLDKKYKTIIENLVKSVV